MLSKQTIKGKSEAQLLSRPVLSKAMNSMNHLGNSKENGARYLNSNWNLSQTSKKSDVLFDSKTNDNGSSYAEPEYCDVMVEVCQIEDSLANLIINLSVEEMYKLVLRNRVQVKDFVTKKRMVLRPEESGIKRNFETHNEIYMELAKKVIQRF